MLCSLARHVSIQVMETCTQNGTMTEKGVIHSVWWVGWERDSADGRTLRHLHRWLLSEHHLWGYLGVH